MWRRRSVNVRRPPPWERAPPGLFSVTVPPSPPREPSPPSYLVSVSVPPSPSPPEPAPPSGLISLTVPFDQTQRGSELTSSMLEPKNMANRCKGELIRKAMNQAKDKDSKVFIERMPRDIVITFIEALEKAHQRLDMREYLLTNCDFIKYDSDANSVVEQLVGSQEGKHKFNGYYKEVIRRSVQVHIHRLKVKKKVQDISPDLHDSDCNKFSDSEKKMPFEPGDPVFELVHRIREKEFVMDLNPEVELEKIKTFNPHFYHVEFIARQPLCDYIPIKSRTVRLGDVPLHTSEQDIMELLSDCGEIERVQMTRIIEFHGKFQVAVVTFKELEGRDNAFSKDLKIDNQPIRIVSRRQLQLVNLVEPVDVRVGSDAEPAKEKAEGVDIMLQILNKYWLCSQRYHKSNLLAAEMIQGRSSPAKNNSVGV